MHSSNYTEPKNNNYFLIAYINAKSLLFISLVMYFLRTFIIKHGAEQNLSPLTYTYRVSIPHAAAADVVIIFTSFTAPTKLANIFLPANGKTSAN